MPITLYSSIQRTAVSRGFEPLSLATPSLAKKWIKPLSQPTNVDSKGIEPFLVLCKSTVLAVITNRPIAHVQPKGFEPLRSAWKADRLAVNLREALHNLYYTIFSLYSQLWARRESNPQNLVSKTNMYASSITCPIPHCELGRSRTFN
jgi:hypothetical protein